MLKYKKDTDRRISEKIAKLSVHSTKKKFMRISQMMIGVQTIDDNFNREERKFTNLDKGVRTLVRDISSYLEQLQVGVIVQ